MYNGISVNNPLPKNGDDSDNGDSTPWWQKLLVGGALALGAVGAVAVAVAAASESKNQKKSPDLDDDSPDEEVESKVVITVDATPGKGGAVFRIPHRRSVSFYTVDWSPHFVFPTEQQSDKFEMLNALIALKVFDLELRRFCPNMRILLQTDNSFANKKYKPFSVDMGQQMFNDIHLQLELMNLGVGFEIKQVQIGASEDMDEADKLSRGRISEFQNDEFAHHVSAAALSCMIDLKYKYPQYVKH